MPSSMLVHDLRVEGTPPPHLAPNLYTVDDSVPLVHALGRIARCAAMHGGLTELMILCHGLESLVEDEAQQVSAVELGFGLRFCKEDLNILNVSRTRALRGLVRTIKLYACGPARTRPGSENTISDGHRFCSELAAWTGAEVIASTDKQSYTMGAPDITSSSFWFGPHNVIDLGPWEGNVYRFLPNGAVSRTCSG
jgi:hypothetical protein